MSIVCGERVASRRATRGYCRAQTAPSWDSETDFDIFAKASQVNVLGTYVHKAVNGSS